MALIAGAMTTLADVKALLGITDTTQDARLEILINSASATIAAACDRVFARSTYTAETHPGTNRQMLLLDQWPIVSVSAVYSGDTLMDAADYELKAQDMSMGGLYKADGWNQNTTYATGLTTDTWASGRDYSVTYIAGYYMPNDVTVAPADPHYVAGAAGSLPLDLSDACNQSVAERFVKIKAGALGLTQITEGGLTYVWGASTTNVNQENGLSSYIAGVVNKYMRRFVA